MRIAWVLASFAAAASLSVPALARETSYGADWYESRRTEPVAAQPPGPPDEIEVGDPVPASGYRLEERSRPGRAVWGALLFTAAWAPGLYLGVNAITCEPRPGDDDDARCAFVRKFEPAIIPLAGPVAMLGSCEGEAICMAILTADAALQGLGLYLLVTGAAPRKVYVRDPGASSTSLAVGATPLPGGGLLSAAGRF